MAAPVVLCIVFLLLDQHAAANVGAARAGVRASVNGDLELTPAQGQRVLLNGTDVLTELGLLRRQATAQQTAIAALALSLQRAESLVASTIHEGGARLYAIGIDTYRPTETPRATEVYDGENWQPAPPMLTPRFIFAAAVFRDLVHAVGGAKAGGLPLRTTEQFDGFIWKAGPQMLGPRVHHAAVVYRDFLYAIGGQGQFSLHLSSVERFDGVAWKAVNDMAEKRTGLAAAVYRRHLYAIGGANSATVERFDGSDWHTAPSLPQPRYGSSAIVHAGKLLVCGGATLTPVNSVFAFDGAVWSHFPPMIVGRAALSTAVYHATLHALGGTTDMEPTNSVEAYDPVEGKWRAESATFFPRQWGGAVVY